TLRGSLQAEVDLYGDAALRSRLESLGEELRFVLLTSEARVHALGGDLPEAVQSTDIPGLKLSIRVSPDSKCARCWHHRADVGSDPAHPDLCGRCIDNVEGEGERRQYA